ncbi:ribonucleoside triphosphate reductase [Patescibacteria group bacterium]|nr:ribonucleoside triphosphate reductase [Patescibacteria group bacterium]
MQDIKKIRKRDGRMDTFDRSKIARAIEKASGAAGYNNQELVKRSTEKALYRINKRFGGRKLPTVEEVQDIVEEVLVISGNYQIAKSYILYREKRNQMRDVEAMINSDELMEQYLKKLDWKVNENSNMTFSLQGLNNYVSSEISSKYWLNRIYTPEIREAHVSGDLHIHDLQLLSPYCCGWDLQDVIMRGFGGVPGKIESKPPKHLRTALGQVVNFFYTLQGESAGAQAFSSFDSYLAPFIAYDKLSYEEVKDEMEIFLFNMNIPTRVGFQTPFTNITMDLNVPNIMKDEPVIIGGKPQNRKYGEFQEEMNMINRAFAEVMSEGDAKGRVFSFPIPTYNITSDFDWDNPIVDVVMEMTAKYGIPYFANYVNSDMDPEDARSMCCRLRLDNRELRKRGGGLFGANPLTGSIGVVTLNLPRLGYLSKDENEFFERIEQLMRIAKQSLDMKRKILEELMEGGLYPYSRHYLALVKERFDEYWKNHFNTIGINGLNEALLNLIGENITTEDGHALGVRTLEFMREKMMDYQSESNNLFNLEATPAEGTSYRFAKIDKERYPDIICANERNVKEQESAPYYTNSSHLPVNHTDDIFEALEMQDELQTKYTGGTVMHGFLGEKLPSSESTKNLVKKIAENFHLPYYTITPTFSVCPKHGYIPGEHHYCPTCDEEIGYSEDMLEEEKRKEKIIQ